MTKEENRKEVRDMLQLRRDSFIVKLVQLGLDERSITDVMDALTQLENTAYMLQKLASLNAPEVKTPCNMAASDILKSSDKLVKAICPA